MFDRVCISQKINTFLFESVLINSAMQTLQAFISGGSSMIFELIWINTYTEISIGLKSVQRSISGAKKLNR